MTTWHSVASCLGRLWGWPAHHAGRTVTFPQQGVQNVRVMAAGQWWQRAMHASFHLASLSPLWCLEGQPVICQSEDSHLGAMGDSPNQGHGGMPAHTGHCLVSLGQGFDLCPFLPILNRCHWPKGTYSRKIYYFKVINYSKQPLKSGQRKEAALCIENQHL